MVEAIDSEESRRVIGWEGLRGGRDGEDCKDGVRGGSLGGAFGFADLGPSWLVRMMVGGGRTPFRLTPLGSPWGGIEPTPRVSIPAVDLLLWSIWGLCSASGTMVVVRTSVPGPLPTWPRLRAAMRSWSDCTFTPSSAMLPASNCWTAFSSGQRPGYVRLGRSDMVPSHGAWGSWAVWMCNNGVVNNPCPLVFVARRSPSYNINLSASNNWAKKLAVNIILIRDESKENSDAFVEKVKAIESKSIRPELQTNMTVRK